jgi:transposase InsO family protein
MPYNKNPFLPKVRGQAVNLVKIEGWSMRRVAKHFGVEPSTVSRWVAQAPTVGRVIEIPTRSSRPRHHPKELSRAVIEEIVARRLARKRCAKVIHGELARVGIIVSLSSVKRVLHRRGLIRPKSPWKKYHQSGERPLIEAPGSLVEMDSVHLWIARERRTYLVTLIDVWSRWAHVRAFKRLTTHAALKTAREAMNLATFSFTCIQSDHGPEFTKYFTTMIGVDGIRPRHSRVRQPNDNAHIERFNRTIQDDLRSEIRRYKTNVSQLNLVLTDYLHYYNAERLHLGLNLKTPEEVLRSY